MMRFEKETQQKEIRQEMKLRLARLQQQQHLTQNKPQIVIGEALMQHGALSRVTMATPSPLTPNSLDELLPSVDENQEVSWNTCPSKWGSQFVYQKWRQNNRNFRKILHHKIRFLVVTLSNPYPQYPPRLEATLKQFIQPQAGGASGSSGAGAALRAAASQSSPGTSNGYHGPCSSSTEAL